MSAVPSARRAAFLAAAALVAVGTLVYAFATRPPLEENTGARLEPDGRRVGDVEVEADGCLRVDANALDALRAALALGACVPDGAPGGGAGTVPTPFPPPGGGAPGGDEPDGSPHIPDEGRDDGSGSGAGGVDAPGADDGARPTWPTGFPPPPSADGSPDAPLPPPYDGDDGIWFRSDDEIDPDDDGRDESTPSPEPPAVDALYDALAPLFSPPRPTTPPPDALPGAPPPSGRCVAVCDPQALGGSGTHPLSADRMQTPPPRVGLLARALEAVDAYVRLRN